MRGDGNTQQHQHHKNTSFSILNIPTGFPTSDNRYYRQELRGAVYSSMSYCSISWQLDTGNRYRYPDRASDCRSISMRKLLPVALVPKSKILTGYRYCRSHLLQAREYSFFSKLLKAANLLILYKIRLLL